MGVAAAMQRLGQQLQRIAVADALWSLVSCTALPAPTAAGTASPANCCCGQHTHGAVAHCQLFLLPPQVVLAGEFEGEDLPLYDLEIRYRGGLKNALLHPNRPGAEHKLEEGQVGGLACVEQWRMQMEQRITVQRPVTAGWPGQQCHHECCW